MIFIQFVVNFLFPRQGLRIENTTQWIKIISHHNAWEILYMYMYVYLKQNEIMPNRKKNSIAIVY
jgi:hypothetical protein